MWKGVSNSTTIIRCRLHACLVASQAAEQPAGDLGLRDGRAEGDRSVESVLCSGKSNTCVSIIM